MEIRGLGYSIVPPMLSDPVLRLQRYLANPDPLAKAAGIIAIVVASNQPFYPLYLYAIVGDAAWLAWLTLLSTPFFLAVPAVARLNSLAGRVLLPIAGVANTVLCVKLLGTASAAELFLLPCILLGALLFRPPERAIGAIVIALTVLAYLLIDPNVGPPTQVFSVEGYQSIIRVHAASVAALTVMIGLLFVSLTGSGGQDRRSDTSSRPPRSLCGPGRRPASRTPRSPSMKCVRRSTGSTHSGVPSRAGAHRPASGRAHRRDPRRPRHPASRRGAHGVDADLSADEQSSEDAADARRAA
jgi:hypothetical protein